MVYEVGMTHRSHQPDARQMVVQVHSVENLTASLYLLKLTGFPSSFQPHAGQFLHLQIPSESHPLLRRPISIQSYRQGMATLLIREVGVGTRILRLQRPGDPVDVLGPLGVPFKPAESGERVLLVGGGVGVAPLLAWCEEIQHECQVDFAYGMADATEIQGDSQFNLHPSIRFHFSTDNGTRGYHGFCTDVAQLLLERHPYHRVLTCGPWMMMKKVVDMAGIHSIPVEVSLEVQMGCGLGACLGCVYENVEGEFIRSCIDGPVVDGYQVKWERNP